MTESATRRLVRIFTPADLRPLLSVAQALKDQLHNIHRADLDHKVAHVQLQWWSEEIQRLAQEVPRHPLTQQLLSLGISAQTAAQALVAQWESVARSFAGFVPPDDKALEDELYAAEGLSAQLLSATLSVDQQRSARQLTLVRALSEVLTHIREDAKGQRLRLPLISLQEAGITPAQLQQEVLPAEVLKLAVALSARVQELWTQLVPARRAPTASRLQGLWVEAALSQRRLTQAQARGFVPVLTHDRVSLPELLLAWRTARGLSG